MPPAVREFSHSNEGVGRVPLTSVLVTQKLSHHKAFPVGGRDTSLSNSTVLFWIAIVLSCK